MDKKTQQTADFYQLVAWAHANRKRLMVIGGIVVAVGAIIGGYVWQSGERVTRAAEELSQLKAPGLLPGRVTAADAQPYFRLAEAYPNTPGGALALLRGAGIMFEAGSFPQARVQFEKFLQMYPDYPLAGQAALGQAACMEAEGRVAEAMSRYEDFTRRHPTDACAEQAKVSLARLYLTQNKPEEAMRRFQEIAQSNGNNSWALEANFWTEELALKYPNLKKEPAPAPALNLAPATPGKL